MGAQGYQGRCRARDAHSVHKVWQDGGGWPLWSQLIKGHPEVDTSGLKRVEKDIEELMAELQNKTGTHAMDGMEYARNMREKMDMS